MIHATAEEEEREHQRRTGTVTDDDAVRSDLPSRRGADGAEDARADHGANRQHDEIAGAEDALERPRLVGDDEIGDGFAGKDLRILNPWA